MDEDEHQHEHEYEREDDSGLNSSEGLLFPRGLRGTTTGHAGEVDEEIGTTASLWKLYLSHTLSTWNARTYEFAAVSLL